VSDVQCPLCGTVLDGQWAGVYLFQRLQCPACGGVLDVVNEAPLRLRARRRGGTTWLAEWLAPGPDGSRSLDPPPTYERRGR